MHRSFLLFSALVVVALIGGCSRGSDGAQGPTATLGTAPTTTARVIDVGVIPADPADIDEAYVQAVVDALFAVDAQATKIFVETKTLDPRGVEILDSIYTPEEADRRSEVWSETLSERASEIKAGTLRNEVQRLVDTAADCVLAEVRSDYSEVTTRTLPLLTNYLGMTPKLENEDLNGRNPTGWLIFMNAAEVDGRAPENPCAGR